MYLSDPYSIRKPTFSLLSNVRCSNIPKIWFQSEKNEQRNVLNILLQVCFIVIETLIFYRKCVDIFHFLYSKFKKNIKSLLWHFKENMVPAPCFEVLSGSSSDFLNSWIFLKNRIRPKNRIRIRHSKSPLLKPDVCRGFPNLILYLLSLYLSKYRTNLENIYFDF